MFNLERFINEYVTKRPESMFLADIEDNKAALTKKIQGKSILVIGGAGSIGSSFVKAVLPFMPGELCIVDTNENALAEQTRDLRSSYGKYMPDTYLSYPMDYSSPVFKRMYRNHKGFDIVANFSAHKHVRSEKDIFSIEALLRNNVINAKGLLDLLSEFPPEEYFCVSTDKAANPVNIMGASKRIMEDLIFSYSDDFPVKTARFANVAFSNGSLPDGFLSRMKKLQPLGAPSDVRRYFVSPIESGQICMLSCMLGDNREIFFPKLEEAQMMRFDEIAEKLLTENGYEVIKCSSDEEAIEKAKDLQNGSKKYPVHFSGSETSGEKAYEEFFTDEENVDMARLKALGIITGKALTDRKAVQKLIEDLTDIFENENATKDKVVSRISDYLPNFNHIETGKSLDNKL
ncbi:MAG: polysaccharide biosynthesis protein [Butyrivibrio sp.]|nr:polysaccharide biosynthesis protein [Butyrivibrio sp.]